MTAEMESPAREASTAASSTTRGRGRGGRSGRGRGRGAGGRGGASNNNTASTSGVTKSSVARGGRGGTRRGRAKNFSDSRVQAAYERQRDLKATYQAVAQALKPALQELAERNIDELLQNPESLKATSEHGPVISQLKDNFAKRTAEHDKRLECDLQVAEHNYNAKQHIIQQEFKVCLLALHDQSFIFANGIIRLTFILFSPSSPVCRTVLRISLRSFMRPKKIAFAY